jgi:hypothetical protein
MSAVRWTVRSLLASLLLAVSLAGCQKSGEKLLPVEGKVQLGGKPLTTGYVILHPDKDKGNTSLHEPRGQIDKQGNYRISTNEKTGAPPGWYKVAVTAADQIDPKNPYFTRWLVPEKYIDYRTSQLAFEVVEQPAEGAYDLSLKEK